VVISGNWYANDAIEIFDGDKKFTIAKDIDKGLARPFIFKTSPDDAVIFSHIDTCGKHIDKHTIHRLHGEPIEVKLFEKWHPVAFLDEHSDDCSFIGDERKGFYAYLFPVTNVSGQWAIGKMTAQKGKEPEFSLLPTLSDIPMKSKWGKINYFSTVVIDKNQWKGYIAGRDQEGRIYILCIEDVRTDGDAELTMYYTDPLEDSGTTIPLVTPEGNIMLAGGYTNSNYTPFSSVYILPLACSTNKTQILKIIPWLIISVVIILAVLMTLHHYKSRRKQQQNKEGANRDESEKKLILSIRSLMDEEQLYLKNDLKLSDISAKLFTNSRYVSEAIKNQQGCSFTQFVNGYRIDHAKEMLSKNPERKISDIATESGFTGESSFFRTFKSFTGITPKEWITRNNS